MRTYTNRPALEGERRERMERMIGGDRYLWTDDARLTEALRWITPTTDQLITRRSGNGVCGRTVVIGGAAS